MADQQATKPGPLKNWERWVYGGAGALAPLVVVVIALDAATVFQDLKPAVLLGWSLKVVALFAVGGFVSFLHKSETEAWKSFVTGISAPALITTALAGTANKAKAAEFKLPTLITTAWTAEKKDINPFAGKIKMIIASDLRESIQDQFKRGFFGDDPPQSYLVISNEGSLTDAQNVAAAVYLVANCNQQNTTKPWISKPIVPTVLTSTDANQFGVIVPLPTNVSMTSKDVFGSMLPVQGFVATTRSKAAFDLSGLAKSGKFQSAKQEWSTMLNSVPQSCDLMK